jgi:hypothetical protein
MASHEASSGWNPGTGHSQTSTRSVDASKDTLLLFEPKANGFVFVVISGN